MKFQEATGARVQEEVTSERYKGVLIEYHTYRITLFKGKTSEERVFLKWCNVNTPSLHTFQTGTAAKAFIENLRSLVA